MIHTMRTPEQTDPTPIATERSIRALIEVQFVISDTESDAAAIAEVTARLRFNSFATLASAGMLIGAVGDARVVDRVTWFRTTDPAWRVRRFDNVETGSSYWSAHDGRIIRFSGYPTRRSLATTLRHLEIEILDDAPTADDDLIVERAAGA